MLCATLKKQMKFLEQQQDETKQAREEARRLRSKMQTMERIELLLKSQRPEVEEMIRDMGAGQAAVEQLAVYCVSLKKEYENLKEARKASGELADKLKKDLFSSKSKLQVVYAELDQAKLELRSAQKDLQGADKEIASLRKKLKMLQETLSLPPGDSEAVNRLVLESPAPVEMLSLKLRRPAFSDDIDLNATFDVDTPPARPPGLQRGPAKKLCLEKARAPTQDGPGKLPKGSTQVRTGFDGLGGRTKFIQPTDTTLIRPLPVKPKAKAKAKQKVGARTALPPSQALLWWANNANCS
uniref:TRAF interacting protein n=2 Tax=Pipistrellus kuhlii TaxID=59472 RepID=A0A7J7WEQ9_PIPKU|nr:TRAF interacting protein [Pipistrellus kuhlii]